MRHVGRRDPETNLLITEVTQAEFDALPELLPDQWISDGTMWRCRASPGPWELRYRYEDDFDDVATAFRLLVIVDQPKPSTSPSTSVSSGDGSAFA